MQRCLQGTFSVALKSSASFLYVALKPDLQFIYVGLCCNPRHQLVDFFFSVCYTLEKFCGLENAFRASREIIVKGLHFKSGLILP